MTTQDVERLQEIYGECARACIYPAVWWFDWERLELVRYRDGRRFETRDVPELRLSGIERRAADMDVVDTWVNAQGEARER